MTEDDQAEAIEALASGRATGDAAPLQQLTTHMSHVFLSPSRAYKLKRARRHPFADLSSLARRRYCCEEELAINQRLAPGLYERVAPIAAGGEGLQLDADGKVVDWIVVMRRFPDGALLSELADRGELSPALVRETAEAVAAFHAGQPAVPEAGRPADYRAILDRLRETAAEGARSLGASFPADDLFDGLQGRLASSGDLLERRRRAGWVRRGHGDLHLRNICVFEGRATPFDALEFDPALATADVLYDIAFLLMDLRARGQAPLANLAMNRYWDVSAQPESALALLPLFMSLRAAVRMAVALEAGSVSEAGHYRQAAWEMLKPTPARLVAIGGLSGTGKTALAKALAPRLEGPCGARILRSDVLRKAAAGVQETDHLAPDSYRPSEKARIYQLLVLRAREALDAGSTVIGDATFTDGKDRRAIAAAAAVGQNRFDGLWLKASSTVRISRVAAREDDASDATAAVAAAQTEPRVIESGWRSLDAEASPPSIEAAAIELLG